MKQSRPRYQQGFSLVEVLIAVVVLSVGLLALATLQSALIRSAADAKAQSLALAVAKQKLEQLQAIQSLGGSDNGCVSPTNWDAGEVSCYRAITDEGATPVDGDVMTAGTQPLGGIDFTVATAVTRYVYNVNTLQYAPANDTALDSALATSNPETLLPGKEFKRIVVTVAWTDATATARQVQVEDAINGIVPRDSLALVMNRRGMTERKAESIIVNPGATAGVIPIAVGNGSSTAASNPKPELIGANNATYVAETRFDVYTYLPLNASTALAQARVETAVVGCRCNTATADTGDIPLRPTYWNGVRYAIPSEASYSPVSTAPNFVQTAGPASGGDPQSVQCRVCCRDHRDPTGNDPNGDAYASVAKFSPYRNSHTHYSVNATSGAQTLATNGAYNEVCRMIRVDGIFRAATDFNNDYFALLETKNTGSSSFVPSSDVADDYSDMAKKYLKARFSENPTPSTFNSRSSPDPYSNSYVQGTRTLSDGVTTRSYDLNLPSLLYLKLSSDAKWLHSRGLYVDYLETEAVDRIVAAQAACPMGQDKNECVLPYLPFTSVNLTELAEWKDQAVIPSPASTSQVISVLNSGFITAVGDATYTGTIACGSCSGTSVSFSPDLPAGVVVGMAVAATGLAANARVVSINNQRNSIVVSLPHTSTVSGTATFQALPVRGIVTPGTSPVSGNTSDAKTIASSNNAAIALKFPMHPDETVLTDTQRFQVSISGSPPDPTAGSFDVTGFSAVTVDSTRPRVAWAVGNSTPSTVDACNLGAGGTLPFVCPATSGLGSGAGMSILIGSYNTSATKAYALPLNSCKIRSGNGASATYVAYTGTGTSSQQRPYVTNYSVASAYTSGVAGSASYAAAGSSPYTVANSPTPTTQLTSETTQLFFQRVALPVLGVKDSITVNLVKEASPNDEVAAALTCCEVEVSNKGVVTVKSVTWKPAACPFTP